MQTEHAVGWLNSKRTSLLFSVLAFALTADFDFLLLFSWFCVSNPDALSFSVLHRSHGQYRTMRVADDTFGGAAEPDVLQPRVAMRGQADQVRTQRLGRVANLFKRLALADNGRNIQPC